MGRKKFNGFIDDKEVKAIIQTNFKGEKMFSAKAKNNDIDTPDFRESSFGTNFHQDASGALKLYRKMDNVSIGSVCLQAGSNFISANNSNLAVLPIEENEGFNIKTSPSGVSLDLRKEGWALVARGEYCEWEEKKEKAKKE